MQNEIIRKTPNDVGEQIIWGNQFITNNRKVLVFIEWIESGFIYVADLFENGIFIKQNKVLNKLQNKWLMQYF